MLLKRVIRCLRFSSCMKFFDAIKRVEESDVFSVPEGSYLVHVFKMFDAANADEWQVGYYDPSSDELIVFTTSSSDVRKNPPAEAFKSDKRVVEPLEASKLVYSPQQAVSDAKQFLVDEHPGHPAKQVILLAQTLRDSGQVYNVTVVTETFHMLNVKIDTSSGEVVAKSFDHLMSLRKD